ncbi:hypothetical protein GCM10009555_097450 [Acrocarpospora macrocephala]|uniref:Type IV secretion protein Rhs n=1 Tax=Acrocarpospora macrocephala TaxID=150177 RepID=A0A5M3X1P5_9ACTN|nr:RHS repeat-associated core domain-containing protein [Acrocarpospora macrocephala]GES12673.1 hypothetical protein Amac_062700 [Acrocarpospora macrocephala]
MRTLKVKWDSAGVRKELEATFTVYDPNEPTPEPEPTPSPTYTHTPGPVTPAKVTVEPGPALKNLWATADNRRAKVEGLYDWSQAGVGGGSVLADDDQYLRSEDACLITPGELAADYDVHPNDGVNDTAGLQEAIDDIKADCSPTGEYTKMSKITLPKGVLNVTRQISVDANYLRIVGQGSGPGGSRIVFRPDANTLYDKITEDGTRWDLDNMNDEGPDGEGNGGWIWPGRGLFRVQSRAVHEDYATAYANAPANRKDLYEGTVNVHWKAGVKVGQKGSDIGYAARKGDTVIKVATSGPVDFDNRFKVGGLVNVRVANSIKFYQQMKALPTTWELQNLHMRQQIFMVVAGDPLAGTLTLDRPLEYDVPLDSTSDGSVPIFGSDVNFSKVSPLVDAVIWVGFENFSFTQDMPSLDKEDAKNNYGNMAPEAAMHGIVFKWAANSWVKGIRAEMTGSHPIVTEEAANLTVADNYMDGSWNKGKGGNGYFRGSRVWNSLYVGNTTRNLRHFTFQWSASGNVAIGNSFDSDLNLHGGFERNNLFEMNEVSTPYAHRSGNCSANCGDEGDLAADDSQWYPIWWAAGKKAVKWSGSSGENNVFFNNHLLKQKDSDTNPFLPYYADRSRVYQFGTDGTKFKHLDVGGAAIADWAHNETKDYTGGHGVIADKTFAGPSLFLRSISLTGYGGSKPQKLKQTWGCTCWDGTGMVNTRLAADPVNTATGALMENFSDLEVPGLGNALEWHRTYNSLDETDGPLSPGWTFAYNASISRVTEPEGEVITFRNGTGAQLRYAKDETGVYKALDPAVTAELTELADGWLLTNLDEETLRFNTDGQLVHDMNEQGKGVTLSYSGGRLAMVSDGLGQTITITWGSTGPATGKIVEIEAEDGRTVEFAYSTAAGAARLTGVTDVTGASTTYSYDAATGMLNGITDPIGRTSAVTTYDPVSKRAIQQADALGAITTFAWDAATQTATITFPDGTTRQDIYDDNVLVSQIGPDGRAVDTYYGTNNEVIAENTGGQALSKSTYDERGNLTKRTLPAEVGDESAPFESWTYDGDNHVTSHTDPLGKTTTYDYDGQGRLVETTYPDGGTVALTYTAAGQVATSTDQLGRTTTFVYNGAGDMIRKTSPSGSITKFTYDDAHHRLTETTPLGNLPGADPGQYTTTWTYDNAGRVLTETDGLGNTTTNIYDAVGQLTQTEAPDGGVTSYTYNAAGSVLTETDPAGRVTTHTYDTAGRETSVVAPGGATTTFAYDATTGRLTSTTGPTGNAPGASAETKRRDTTAYAYDAAGRRVQTRVVDPGAPSNYLVTHTAYDIQGRPVKETQPDGSETITTYDAAGRVVKTESPAGTRTVAYDEMGREKTVTEGGVSVENTYDDAGQLTRSETGGGAVTTYSYDDDGQRVATVDPRGNAVGADPDDYTVYYVYDVNGRRTEVVDQLGRSATVTYDPLGRTLTATDAAGNTSAFEHDVMGNVTKVTTATGAITQYAYNPAGQVTQVTNPRGGVTTVGYDPAGRIASQVTPGGRTSTFAYDPAGRLAAKTLPSGHVTYTYDSLGRPATVDHSDASADLAYTYDKAGRPVKVTQTTASGSADTTYTYDSAGRVTGVNGASGGFGYEWNTDGRLTERTLPGGRSQSYTYGADGRLAGTTLTGTATAQIDYTYDAAGQLTQISRPGGPTTIRAYDRAGALTSQTHTAAGATLVGQDITYTPTGSPATVTTTRGMITAKSIYTYDDDGRLTKVCQAVGGECTEDSPYNSYAYDLNGNRTEQTTFTGTPGGLTSTFTTYDTDDRAIQDSAAAGGPATATYVYDDNGNLHEQTTAAGTRTFAYGLDTNLQTLTLEDARIVGYTYDSAGNRITRAVNGTADASWTWDTVGDLPVRVAEADAAGTLTHQWWSDPAAGLGTALADTAPTGTTWLLPDYQGTLTDTADTAALTGSAAFGPYGEPQTTAGSYAANPLRFHGQYLDTVTGLYDIRARDYNAASGSFTAIDPEPAKTGTPFVQTYHYGYNNPTTLTDPSGRCAWLCFGIVGAVVGGIVGAVDAAMNGGNVWKGAAIGAATGFLTGVGLGALGAAGFGATATFLGGMAITGAGNAAYQYFANGQTSPGQIASNFGWGAAGYAAGAAVSALAAPVISRVVANWAPKKFFGNVKDILCSAVGRSKSDWALKPFDRGFSIEAKLGGNLPAAFKTIDKWENGIATSIKSLDTRLKTYQSAAAIRSKVKAYIDSVAGFNGGSRGGVVITRNQIRGRALELAVPKGAVTAAQWTELNAMVTYGTTKNVVVTILEMK